MTFLTQKRGFRPKHDILRKPPCTTKNGELLAGQEPKTSEDMDGTTALQSTDTRTWPFTNPIFTMRILLNLNWLNNGVEVSSFVIYRRGRLLNGRNRAATFQPPLKQQPRKPRTRTKFTTKPGRILMDGRTITPCLLLITSFSTIHSGLKRVKMKRSKMAIFGQKWPFLVKNCHVLSKMFRMALFSVFLQNRWKQAILGNFWPKNSIFSVSFRRKMTIIDQCATETTVRIHTLKTVF